MREVGCLSCWPSPESFSTLLCSVLCLETDPRGGILGDLHASWILVGSDQWEASETGGQQEREVRIHSPCPLL